MVFDVNLLIFEVVHGEIWAWECICRHPSNQQSWDCVFYSRRELQFFVFMRFPSISSACFTDVWQCRWKKKKIWKSTLHV